MPWNLTTCGLICFPQWWTTFYVLHDLICHLISLFGEMAVPVFGPFSGCISVGSSSPRWIGGGGGSSNWCLCTPDASPFQSRGLQIFLPVCHFSSPNRKILNFAEVQFIHFFFMGHAFGVKFKNQCWVLNFLVLSKNFIVVRFTFKSVIHWVSFSNAWGFDQISFLKHIDVQLLENCLLKQQCFLH